MRTSPHVCVPCRRVERFPGPCPECGEELVYKHHKWRAPKKTNDKAWKLIEQHDWLWDKRALRGKRLGVFNQEAREVSMEKWRRINPKFGRNVTDKKK